MDTAQKDMADPLPDIAEFLERAGGDWEFARELIGIFIQESPHLLAEILDAAAMRNGSKLKSAAHALKGSIANFTMGPAFGAAAALEAAGKDKDFSQIDTECSELDQEMSRLCAYLRGLLSINPAREGQDVASEH